MKQGGMWLERRKAALCLLMALCAISLCVIYYNGGSIGKNAPDSYSVTIRHYGINASEMERTVTIPLEDEISQIPGVSGFQSFSENSSSKIYVSFDNRGRKSYNTGQYSALREAAQRVYENLPSSAQRPEIQSSGSSRVPVWAAVVTYTGDAAPAVDIEKIIKPKLESLEGAGEVLVSGEGPHEVIVRLDQDKTTALGLAPYAVASIMAMNDSLFPGGMLRQDGREIILTVDGRFSMDGANGETPLGSLLVPIGNGMSVSLSEIASVTEQERRPDTYSRINGKKATVISVMAGSGADLGKLSKNIQKEIDSLPFEFTVLCDRGAEETAALCSLFSAAIQGALMVAFICFLLNRQNNDNNFSVNYTGIFCGLSVPVVCLVSAAVLCVSGLTLNRIVLAGISAGVGSAVDAILLCSEKMKKCKKFSDARSSLKLLCGPLIAGSVTTVAALVPIPAMGNSDAGIIAVSIAAVTLCALIIGICVLPPLLLWGLNAFPKPQRKSKFDFSIFHVVTRFYSSMMRFFSAKAARLLAINVNFIVKYPRYAIIAGIIITLAGLGTLFVKGADSGEYGSGNSVYAHVEFESGLLAEEADVLLAAYGETLAKEHGIVNVETAARAGSGSVMAAFDPKITNAGNVMNFARKIPISGAFLFFPETASGERHWEIKVFGDDAGTCREIAEKTATALAAVPLVKERVLNFKQGSQRLDLYPNREKMAMLGQTFSRMADAVRRGIHGSVAYKRVSSQGETDVRVRLGGDSDFLPGNQVAEILSGSGNAEYGHARGLYAGSFFSIKNSREISGLRREDRRRIASITITANAADPRRVKKQLTPILDKINLPPGYSIEFDPVAIRQAQALSKTVIYFLLALLFCYMVLAAVNESFFIPLAILCTVPPSMAVPAIFISAAGLPFNTATACAFVAVSGMAVNAAVLCSGGLKAVAGKSKKTFNFCLFHSLRQNLPALAATTLTTIAGSVPFLFLREGANAMIKAMALVTALGVGGSCFFAVSIVPAIIILKDKEK